jgi:HEAT repeat protein
MIRTLIVAVIVAAPLAAQDKPVVLEKLSVADLIKRLDEKEPKDRRLAARELGRRKDAAAVAPLLTTLKNDKEPGVRTSAAEALGTLKKVAKAAVPDLLAALKDGGALVRETAAESLADIGEEPKTVVPALIKLLEDADMNVRCAAAISLGDFKLLAQSAVPALEKVRKNDKHLFAREAADEAIHAISKAASKIGS